MKIQVKQTDGLVIPSRAPDHKSSGYDMIAVADPEIVGSPAKEGWNRIDYIQYRTGLFLAPQSDSYGHDYHTLIMPRSSVSKYNLMLCNSVALIDTDYRGELLLRFNYLWQPEDFRFFPSSANTHYVMVGLVNESRIYKKGDAIGQLVAEVMNEIDFVVIGELSQTVRGTGGFGSREERQIKPALPQVSPLLAKFQESAANVPHHTSVTYESAVKEREKQV